MLHSIMITTPGLIQLGSLSHDGPAMPTERSTWLTIPCWPLSSNRNRPPTATAGVTLGR
jgi:hypothetical protein